MESDILLLNFVFLYCFLIFPSDVNRYISLFHDFG